MKKFRKTEEGLFICEECGKCIKTLRGLSIHISKIHKLSGKEYYDKWLLDKTDNHCKECGRETKFKGRIYLGYSECCSQACHNLHNFGETSFYKTSKFKKKRKESLLNRYGVEEPLQCKKFVEKRKITCFEKYGYETPKLNKLVNKKYKETCFEKYGVENSMHNYESFDKMQKTSKVKRKFRNTDIWYQGSYELDFLEKFYDKFTDIQRAPSIQYIFKEKNKIYYPDFYIPSLNLIIEIKSSYYYNKHKEIINLKKRFVLKNEYKFILIIDKNYQYFQY